MSVDGGTDKDVHIYNGILLSHKKDEIMPCAVIRIDLETTLLSELSQTEKDRYHMISFICGILKKKKRVKLNLFKNQK